MIVADLTQWFTFDQIELIEKKVARNKNLLEIPFKCIQQRPTTYKDLCWPTGMEAYLGSI